MQIVEEQNFEEPKSEENLQKNEMQQPKKRRKPKKIRIGKFSEPKLKKIEYQKKLLNKLKKYTNFNGTDPNKPSFWCSKSELKFFDRNEREDVVGLISAPGSGMLLVI